MIKNPAFFFHCPVCNDSYIHLGTPIVLEGHDSYHTEMKAGSQQIPVRGDVISIPFWGECGVSGAFRLGFHKGQTLVWTEVPISCKPDYHTYIQSAEWKATAAAAKEAAGWRCQICNRPSTAVTLDAHHRTYERLGHERPEDITVLCRDCHELYESNRKARANGEVQL